MYKKVAIPEGLGKGGGLRGGVILEVKIWRFRAVGGLRQNSLRGFCLDSFWKVHILDILHNKDHLPEVTVNQNTEKT